MLHFSLPSAIYSVDQIRQIDQLACTRIEGGEFSLMLRAAAESLQFIQQQWADANHLLVVCGKGNNAGDGLLLAMLAARAHFRVDVYMLEPKDSLSASAKRAYVDAQTEPSIRWCSLAQVTACCQQADVVVDALLGIGLEGAPRQRYTQIIELINARAQQVLALDVPSGLCAQTGVAPGAVIRATASVCFIGLKLGLVMHAGLEFCGAVVVADLQLPSALLNSFSPIARVNMAGINQLPMRHQYAHKNSYASVLVVGGARGMGGAAMLAAQAAARSGAGLVSLATLSSHATAMLARCPEVMAHAVNSAQELEALLQHADVIVVGPGLNDDAWSQQMLHTCLASDKPLVLDAGALKPRFLNQENYLHKQRLHNCILTPHPGEAARLLNTAATQTKEINALDVQRDRYRAIIELERLYNATIVLKGAGTLVAAQQQLAVTPRSNPALATAGSGDVLAGMIAAFVAQYGKIDKEESEVVNFDSATLAVNLHLQAADFYTACKAQETLLASELIDALCYIMRRDS